MKNYSRTGYCIYKLSSSNSFQIHNFQRLERVEAFTSHRTNDPLLQPSHACLPCEVHTLEIRNQHVNPGTVQSTEKDQIQLGDLVKWESSSFARQIMLCIRESPKSENRQLVTNQFRCLGPVNVILCMVECLSRVLVSGCDIPDNQAAPAKAEARHRRASKLPGAGPASSFIPNASDADENHRNI
jgi:hypothetical protein